MCNMACWTVIVFTLLDFLQLHVVTKNSALVNKSEQCTTIVYLLEGNTQLSALYSMAPVIGVSVKITKTKLATDCKCVGDIW